MNKIKILSASNLPPIDEKPPSAYVEVFGIGARRFYLGKTKDISNNLNPQWNSEISFAFFRAYELEFVIKNHKAVGKDIEICRSRFNLESYSPGKHVDLEIETSGNYFTVPVLSFSVDFFVDNLRFEELKGTTAFCIYITYDAPLPNKEKPAEIPVEVKVASMYPNGDNLCIFGSNSDWSYIGGSTGERMIRSGSGWTQVHWLGIAFLLKCYTHFIICPNDYTGDITMHIIGFKSTEESMLHKDFLEADDSKIGEMTSRSYHVSKGIPCTSDFYIAGKGNIVACKQEFYSNEPIEEFENRVVLSITSPENRILRRRVIGTDQVIYVPTKFAVVVGNGNVSNVRENENGALIYINIYDKYGEQIKSWNNRFKGFLKCRNVRVETPSSPRHIDGETFYFDFENVPQEASFITCVVNSSSRLASSYCCQNYVRVTNVNKDQEFVFYTLDDKTSTCKSCHVFSLIKGEDGWSLNTRLHYYPNKKIGFHEAFSCEFNQLPIQK